MSQKSIPELKLEDLNRYYQESEECDKRIFAEMRTNLQMVAGEHYVREGSKFWNRIRDDKNLTAEQRLRLTKNHTQRVTKIYRNCIESFAPGVQCIAANEKELRDQKVAEMHQAYWIYTKDCLNFKEKRAMWIKNFVEIGEVFVKIFWEPNGGNVIGYEAQMQTHTDGNDGPVLDEAGQPVQDPNKPVYGGKPQWETFEAYNVRRDRDARSLDESPYLLLSKITSKNKLLTLVADPEARKKLENAPLNEYTIFDNNSGYYKSSPDQCLVKEIYFKPAPAIPKGYFYIYTDSHIIVQGELPYGIYPIVWEGFDEQTGNPRHHTVIRHIRPAQIEINRCASKIAEHQVVQGDDKVYIQQNAKVTPGAFLPGQRLNYYTGAKPEVIPGRTGDQYLDYLNSQIDELYLLAELKEILEESNDNPDMYASLFKSFRFRRKFAIYGEKIERFLSKVCKTTLAIAKASASEHDIIPAIGKGEYINMAEFKSAEDIHYQIRVEPQSEDIESQFGKQITLNHILQYVGPNLGKEEIGQMIRLSPFLNKEQSLTRFTMKWDNITNDILALDRGQYRPARKFDDHDYIIEALTHRMSLADYEHLNPMIHEMYEMKLEEHQAIKAHNLEELRRAQAGFIPTSGYLAKVDLYMGDPENPTKVKRIQVPSDSISWLVRALAKQGTELGAIDNVPQDAAVDIAQKLSDLSGTGMGANDAA